MPARAMAAQSAGCFPLNLGEFGNCDRLWFAVKVLREDGSMRMTGGW
jgi:hypothetical protein